MPFPQASCFRRSRLRLRNTHASDAQNAVHPLHTCIHAHTLANCQLGGICQGALATTSPTCNVTTIVVYNRIVDFDRVSMLWLLI